MSKLLRADFRRLFKSKFFYFGIGVMFLMGLVPIDRYNVNKNLGDRLWSLDDDYFAYSIILYFITVILTTLFVGVEYSCGTIRNKIAVGHKRSSIYFSNLIVLVTANVIWCAVYLATSLSVGIPLLGIFKEKPSSIALYILVTFTMVIAMTSIVLCIAMLCSNRTHTAIISLVTAIALIIGGMAMNGILAEPEYYDSYAYLDDETGEIIREESQPNPNYVTGTKRLVLEKLLEINPGGQVLEISGMEVRNFASMAGYDFAIIVLSMGVGLYFFKRKDIK